MKKILYAVIVAIIMLPVVVFADAVVVNPYYNSKVMVDGELEVHIPIDHITDYELEISYDNTFLQTSKELVTISKPTSVTLVNGEAKETKNLFDVTVEGDKVKVKTKVNNDEAVAGDMPPTELNIKFKALKEGTTKFNIGGNVMYPSDHTVTIVSNNCVAADDTEPVAPAEPSEEGTDIEGEMKPVKEEKRDKDLILYCSLGVNAILLVALIVSLITRKKKVEPAPTPAPVVEPVAPAAPEPVADETNNQNNE